MTETLSVGDSAPDFNLETIDGSVKLSDYAGQYLVLYFYPKDDTPGCTTEALDFTENLKAFKSANAAILGVSKDSVAKHQKFTDKHKLKVTLGADEDGTVCESYGVWVEKKMYGKTYMGIQRATFLIGPDAKIVEVWPKVKVKQHVQSVLEKLNEHTSS